MIKSVNITNFKSIKDYQAKLPFFGAIVGNNAAGKTNLIQAIRFIRDLTSGESTAESQKKISLAPNELFNFNNTTKEFQIEITLETKTEDKYVLNVKVGLINDSVKPASLAINQEILYKLFEDNQETVYKRGQNGLFDKDGSPISVAVEKNKLALAVYKNPDTDAVRNVFINTLIPDIDIVSNLHSLGIGSLDSEEKNLANILVGLKHKQPDLYNSFQKIIKKLLPDFSSIVEIAEKPIESDDKQNYLVVLEEQNLKGKLSMRSVSGGDLRTLFLIASTISMEDNSTLIVEEIENGMHPKRIENLLDHLETISRRKNIQIIFTTHNPTVINFLSPSKVLFVEKSPNKGTQFKLLKEARQVTKIEELLRQGGKLTDFLNSFGESV